MSGDLGALVISLRADLASFTAPMQQAQRQVDTTAAAMVSSADRIAQGFGAVVTAGQALAGAFVVTKVLEFTKGVVESAEQLQNLAAVTGSSVEALSQLSNVAAVTGTDFGTFQTLLTRMTTALAGVDEESSKGAKALAFLGISAKDPAAALQEVADKLNTYADDASKAALARDLFGRGGPQFIDALKKMADAHDILATRTSEDARQAQLLAEQIRLLQVQSTTMADTILRQVVPALAQSTSEFNAGRAAGLGFFEALNNTTQTMAGTVLRVDELTAKIATLQKQLANVIPNTPAAMFSGKAQDDLRVYTAQLNVLLGVLHQMTPAQAAWKAQLDKMLPSSGYSGGADAAKAAADAAAKAAQQLIEKLKEESLNFGLDTLAIEANKAAKLGVSKQTNDYIVELQRQSAAQQDADRWVKQIDADIASGAQTSLQVRAQSIAAWNQEITSSADLAAQLNVEVQTFGLSDIARQRWILTTLRDTEAQKGNLEAVKNVDTALANLAVLEGKNTMADAIKASAKAADDMAREFQRAADSIEKSLESAFIDAFDSHGKSIAADFKQWLEKLFASMVLRPLLQPVASSIAGLAGGAGGAQSGIGGLSSLSTPFGGASGAFGAFAGSSVGTSLGLSTGVASDASLLAMDATGAAAFEGAGAVAGGALTSAGAAIAAAIPVIGWIAAAGALIYSVVQANKKPAETQGTFGITSGSGGFEDAQSTASAFGNVGFLDQGTQQFSGAAAQSFNTLVSGMLDLFAQRETSTQQTQTASNLQSTNFGTQSGTFTTEDFLNKYGSGVLEQVAKTAFDVLDPALSHVIDLFQGDAQSTVTFIGSLLSLHDSLSKLPTDVAGKLVAAADGTQAMLDKLNTFAVSYLAIQDLMNDDPIADATTYLSQQSATATDKLNTQAAATEALIASSDDSSTALLGMANAAQATYSALVQAIAQAQQFKQSIDGMFKDTIRSLTLQTLDSQGKYNFYQNDADALRQQLLTTKDPAAIQALASRINDDINSAFNLLSPEQQQQNLQQYVDHITEIDQQAQQQIDAATTDMAATLNTVLTDLRDKFDDVANKFGAGADKFDTAAETALEAAKTPLVVHVDLNTNPSEVD